MQVYSDEGQTITTGEQSCVGVREKLKSSNTVWYNCKKGCQRTKTEKQTYNRVKKRQFNNRCITDCPCLPEIYKCFYLIISHRLFTRWKNKFRKHFTQCTRLMANLKKKKKKRTDTYFTKAFCFHSIEFVAPTTTALLLASIVTQKSLLRENKTPILWTKYYFIPVPPVLYLFLFLSVPTQHFTHILIHGGGTSVGTMCWSASWMN